MSKLHFACLVLVLSAGSNGVNGQCCPCDGDVNGDAVVNAADTTAWQNCFQNPGPGCAGCTAIPNCDVDCDGQTDFADGVAIACIINDPPAQGTEKLSCCGAGRSFGPLPPCECVEDMDCVSGQTCIDNACVASAVPAMGSIGVAIMLGAVLIGGSVIVRRYQIT